MSRPRFSPPRTSPTVSPTCHPPPATPPSASCGSCPPTRSDRIRCPAKTSASHPTEIPGRRPTARTMSPEPLTPHVSTRDEPVHLSDSRPETHQHWPPAGASCCQSLLLDPNAMIRIDLHNRLSLLVTGRAKSP